MTVLADFSPLKDAERVLLDSFESGEFAFIGTGQRPADQTSINHVRASFIRFLLVKDDSKNKMHERGLQLAGAWIEGELDLIATKIYKKVKFLCCRFNNTFICQDATFQNTIIFENCLLREIKAQRAQFMGSLYLRENFECTEEVNLDGAIIHGSLDATSAKFLGLNDKCLNAESLYVGQRIALRQKPWDSTSEETGESQEDRKKRDFVAKGEVRLNCIIVKDLFIIRNIAQPISLKLKSSTVGFLEDDASSWGTNIDLDGFTYTAIRADNTAVIRLAWLRKQSTKDFGSNTSSSGFKPQPWQQLITVLRKTGHKADANAVAIERENHLRRIGLISGMGAGLHWVFGLIAGYGYKPMRLAACVFWVWLGCGFAYWEMSKQGVFAPSSPLVFQNEAYKDCSPADATGAFDRSLIDNDNTSGATHNWFTCGKLKGEYTTFSPLAYSLDVILPLVDLGQEKDWGVFIDTPKGNPAHELVHFSWNHFARLLVWFEILFGWIASLLLVAVLTGKTQRDSE